MRAREAALKVLYEVEKNGAYLNIALHKLFKANSMEQREKALCSELCNGVIEYKAALDYGISCYSKIKLKKLSPWIHNILRLGIYQVVYLDKIPDTAAVNECVKLAKRYGHGASAGFVNALLRNVVREGLPSPPKEDLCQYLSITYSYPSWMVQDWLDEYGAETTQKLLEAGNQKPPLYIRVNRLKTSGPELEGKLKIEATRFHPDVYRYCGEGDVGMEPAFKAGLFTIQDAAFFFAGLALHPEQGQTVLDCCAAPGGKTTHMAELMKNMGKVLAFDIFEHKIKLIEQTAQRLGISIVETRMQDATIPIKELQGACDRVLCDVPCSGYGIIRRKPDIKWNRSKEEVANLPVLQYDILKQAAQYVKTGGSLVYSTCTFRRAENLDVVKRFLAAHSDFEPLPFHEGELPFSHDTQKDGYLQLYPHIDGTDGMFLFRMIRKNGGQM